MNSTLLINNMSFINGAVHNNNEIQAIEPTLNISEASVDLSCTLA